jgi:fibronectin-binding autotransporter adhesin
MHIHKVSFAAVFALLVSAGISLRAVPAHAASLTWDNDTTDGLWSTCDNWTGNVCPGVGDTVTFDPSVSDTSSVIDASFSGEVGAVSILSGFTGTITQDRSFSVTRNGWAWGSWSQAGGTFAGDTDDISVEGSLSLSGGTLTSTTGNLTIRGDVTISSGADFDASTGTVTAAGTYAYWNFDTSETFHNLTISKADYWSMDFGYGDTVNVDGTLLLTDGAVGSGLINARGDVTQAATFDGGGVVVDFENSSPVAQTVTINGGSSPVYRLDDAADADDAIVIAADTKLRLTVTSGFGANDIPVDNSGDHVITLASYSQAAGTWDASGTTLMKTNNNSNAVIITLSGGTFIAPETFELTGLDNVIDVNGTQTFNNLTSSLNTYWNTWMYGGDTFIVNGTLTLTSGAFNGATIEAHGDIVQGAGFGGGNATLDFGDSASQTYDINGGNTMNVRLDSADDASDVININADASMRLAITSGFGANNVPIVNATDKVISFPSYNQAAGTFDASGMTLIKMEAYGGSPSFTVSGGTFTPPETVEFRGYDAYIDVNSFQSFNNLKMLNGWTCILGSGDTLVTHGTLTLSSGFGCAQGAFEAKGDVNVTWSYGSSWSNTPITFGGVYNQTFDLTGATGNFNGNVSVDKSAGTVSLASALVMDAGRNLTITEGTFDLSGNNLTVTGSGAALVVEDGAILRLEGSEAITTNTGYPQLNTGSYVYYDGASGPYTLKAYAYHNLILNSSGTTFNLPGDLDVNGTVTIDAGTLDATANDYNINLAGNWSNSGSFNARGGSVILDGDTQGVFGSTTFNDFTKSVTSASTLVLGAGATQTFTGALTLSGISGDLLSLRSSDGGVTAMIDPQGSVSVDYTAVRDSDNVNTTAITCGAGCVDSGNNTNWVF